MQPTFQAAPVPTFDQANASLGKIYDPQTSLVNQQLADLPNQERINMSALDQAKTNAFADITTGANAKGMLFSGFPINSQARYVGEKYLPAAANLKSTLTSARYGLLGTLNKLNADRFNQAQDIITKGQQAANDAAYKNAQLQLEQAKLQLARSGGGLTAKQQMDLQNAAQMHADTQKLSQALAAHAGTDGYVSPNDYKAALREWNNAGYDATDFNNFFAGFRNPGNPYYGVSNSPVSSSAAISALLGQ